MDDIRIPCIVWFHGDPPPDLSGISDPIRIPFTLRARHTDPISVMPDNGPMASGAFVEPQRAGIRLAASYFEMFGGPALSVHAIERMNETGISPTQLNGALSSSPLPGLSPGTLKFMGGGITAIVNEDGLVVTVY